MNGIKEGSFCYKKYRVEIKTNSYLFMQIERNGESKPIHAHVVFNFYFDHFDTLFFILD